MTAAWSNEHIYNELACSEFLADYEAVLSGCEEISQLSSQLVQCEDSQAVTLLQAIQQSLERWGTTLAELRAYVFGHLAIDGSDLNGQKWQGKLEKAQAGFEYATSAYRRFLATCDKAIIDEFLAAPGFAAHSFQIKRLRQQASACAEEKTQDSSRTTGGKF